MSKTVLLRSLLLRAWRERWNDCQWGLNIKKILPRGVSGDAYNLADCILQQAVVGSGANQLIFSYLRHSLFSHLVSFAAVLKWISNYEIPDNHNHLLRALLDFIDSIVPAVSCNNRQEEILMVDATNRLISWLWKVFVHADSGDQHVLEKLSAVLEKMCNNDFLLGILYLSKVEKRDEDAFELKDRIQAAVAHKSKSPVQQKIIQRFQNIMDLQTEHLQMTRIEQRAAPTITYILQPLLVVELMNNAGNDTRIVSQLLLVQKLKRFTRSQFYCEILRSCLLTLQNVSGTPRESLWCAFTFIKIPQILKLLNGVGRSGMEMEVDGNADLLQAIDLLLEETSLLDILDFKCSLNTTECLMREFQKHGLVTDKHTEHYAAKREGISSNVQKLDPSSQTPSIVKFVIRAEQPLAGILKTLSTDYNKVQEALLSLLSQVMHGNSLELILSVATVEGKLKTFVSRLIKCNECSKQVPGETGKPAATRAALFDVTFLYLTNIVQTYGTDLIDEHGDSFFETWVRKAMVDRRTLKSPMTIVRGCDQVDDLLVYLNGSGQGHTTLKWHEIAENVPGTLYQVLLAWENGLSSMEVKVILDNLKTKMGTYSVCAASWLCTYMYAINEEEHAKPLNMIQQLLTPGDDAGATENFKERLGLTHQIVRRMQMEFQSRGASKSAKRPDAAAVVQSVVSSNPLEESFNDAWEQISERKWLPVEVAQTLESLYESCGAFWLVQRLIHELDKSKYVTEIDQVTDLVFSIMHLDIEAMAVALLSELLPVLMSSDLSHPYATAIARLCVYVILSVVEMGTQQQGGSATKKRTRMEGDDTTATMHDEPTMKMRRLDTILSDDLLTGLEGALGKEQTATGSLNASGRLVREPLAGTIKEMFRHFAQYVASDEYSPRVNFIFEFITILVECGKSDAVPVLCLIPAGFVQSLLKIMPHSSIKAGFVLQLYDLATATGRQAALSDLCTLRRVNK